MPKRAAAGTGAVIACILACLAALAWGFSQTSVVRDGLVAVWDDASARRFLIFVIVAGAVLAAAARRPAPRAT